MVEQANGASKGIACQAKGGSYNLQQRDVGVPALATDWDTAWKELEAERLSHGWADVHPFDPFQFVTSTVLHSEIFAVCVIASVLVGILNSFRERAIFLFLLSIPGSFALRESGDAYFPDATEWKIVTSFFVLFCSCLVASEIAGHLLRFVRSRFRA